MIRKFDTLRDAFDKIGVDAIYITSKFSHRYFTKLDNPDGAILVTKNSIYALEDFRYTEIANKLLGSFCNVICPEKSFGDTLNDILKSENIKRLGIENYNLTLYQFDRLKMCVECELVGIDDTITKMREIKDEYEISCIKKAQEITDMAYLHILKLLSPSMTENDVACELEYFMRKSGAEDKSFDTIAISGEKSSMPHGVPSSIKLQQGFLTMDFGAVVDGYHSDMTRTVSIGKADKKMKKVYNTVLLAQKSALEYLKAGVKCADADKVARDIINANFKGCFGHSLGHSVGLEIHETPNLSPRAEQALTLGNVVTVEPGIYIPKFGGVRIEDLVVIREGGIENLTVSSKELIEIY